MIEITANNIVKNFGAHRVLQNLSIKVKPGTTLVIIGRSGCGKSVLLKHMIGLIRPDAGEVLIDGQDLWKMDAKQMNKLRFRMNMVFQGGALFDSLSVGENVGFELIEHYNIGGQELFERVEESLSLVGLSGIANLMPAELSGGMRKRVGLARALMLEPQIIMYDEPTSGLDPVTCRMVDELIVETRDRFGVTSVVISHDMTGALQIADHIYMMSEGRLVTDGSPADLVKSQADLVQRFIAASGVSADRVIAERTAGGSIGYR